MSCNTPWPNDAGRRRWLAGACGAALLAVTPWARAAHPQLPGGVQGGSATLRFLGLQVYHARLWTVADFDPQRLGEQPLVLELEYLRNFSASAIADRSIVEMRRSGSFADDQAERWNSAMRRVFPDIKAGDRLTGVHRPGQGASFLFNDRPAGEIADPEFSRLFFSIWLGPNTSEPGMRRQLLAQWLGTGR